MNCWHLLILLVALASEVFCDCYITSPMVTNTNRIFLYRDNSGSYKLQRTEIVQEKSKLYMFCNGSDIIETTCEGNGRFSVNLPLRCANPMDVVVNRISDKECPDTLYGIGYEIKNQFLELYRSCFNAKYARVLYSESDVYYKSYFPQRSHTQFLTDGIFTRSQEASYIKRNIYETFQNIFGNNQTYWPNDRALVINRGHLVACADFLFADQMASTFRYLNVVPQMKDINDGNWEKIERWVRSQIPMYGFLHVKSGGINVLQLLHEEGYFCPVYLLDQTIPVPEWTYKIVKNASQQTLYIFLTYNNIWNMAEVPAFCKSVKCPNIPNFANTTVAGLTYCCDPANFVI